MRVAHRGLPKPFALQPPPASARPNAVRRGDRGRMETLRASETAATADDGQGSRGKRVSPGGGRGGGCGRRRRGGDHAQGPLCA